MRPIIGSLLLGLVFAHTSARTPPRYTFLRPGVTWTYRATVEWADTSNRGHRAVIDWRTRLRSVRQRDGITIAEVEGWPQELAWYEPGQRPKLSILVDDGARLTHFAFEDSTAALAFARDSSRQAIRRAFSAADFVVDSVLSLGRLYGRDSLTARRNDALFGWMVEARCRVPRVLLAGRGDVACWTLSYEANTDHQLVDFSPALGVARYRFGHHGTVANVDARLASFSTHERSIH